MTDLEAKKAANEIIDFFSVIIPRDLLIKKPMTDLDVKDLSNKELNELYYKIKEEMNKRAILKEERKIPIVNINQTQSMD